MSFTGLVAEATRATPGQTRPIGPQVNLKTVPMASESRRADLLRRLPAVNLERNSEREREKQN